MYICGNGAMVTYVFTKLGVRKEVQNKALTRTPIMLAASHLKSCLAKASNVKLKLIV